MRAAVESSDVDATVESVAPEPRQRMVPPGRLDGPTRAVRFDGQFLPHPGRQEPRRLVAEARVDQAGADLVAREDDQPAALLDRFTAYRAPQVRKWITREET